VTEARIGVLAVSNGVVVIVIAVAVVLVVLIVALSMRGRQVRAANQRDSIRRDRAEGRNLTKGGGGVSEEPIEGTDPDS
jgi:uncharacterized membrane protein